LSDVTYRDVPGVPYNGAAPDLGAFEIAPAASVTYTFTGNGNWDAAANWANNTISPATIVSSAQIIINPVDGGECVLNIPYTVAPGASLTVMTGKIFRITSNLSITD